MSPLKVVIALGADHAGFELKGLVATHLKDKGYLVTDFGTFEPSRADYPVYARKVADKVAEGEFGFGILICGTGIGMAMAANRHPKIRAANCTSEFLARMARAHNDANILTLGQRVVGPGLSLSIVDSFLGTSFEGGRHQERITLF